MQGEGFFQQPPTGPLERKHTCRFSSESISTTTRVPLCRSTLPRLASLSQLSSGSWLPYYRLALHSDHLSGLINRSCLCLYEARLHEIAPSDSIHDFWHGSAVTMNLFLRQVWALIRKNLLIICLRRPISTFIRAFAIPLAVILILAYSKDFFASPVHWGISSPHNVGYCAILIVIQVY